MRDGRRAFLLVLLAVSVPAAPSLARRQPPAPPADPAQVEARQRYDAGRAKFDAGQYEEALTDFRAAYEARPHPIVLKSVAECLERLERFPEAREVLEQYLRDSPEGTDRAEIERRIAAIRARPAVLVLTSTPEGATVRIDGEDTDKATPTEVEVRGGEHQVTFLLEGYESATEAVAVEGAERKEIAVTLAESPAPPEPETTATAEASVEVDTKGSSAAVWIFGGLTGVALVGGSVLGFMAFSDQAEFDENPTREVKNRGERMALFADIAFGVALAAGVTTLVLVASSGGSDDEEASGEAGLAVVPLASREGAAISLGGRF